MPELLIDQKTFADLIEMVGADFIGELLETFFEEAPRSISQMHQALDQGDAEAFRREAHSLKSNSASFGAHKLAALARELEFMGRDGNLAGAQEKLEKLESEYQQAQQALRGMA